jgi:vitamin B12 transporter
MRVFLLLFFYLLCIELVNAQTTLTGVVLDNKNGSIPGANIFLKDTYDGGSSDANGHFSFKTTETGEQVLVVTCVGFQNWEEKIILNGTEQNIKAVLKEAISELKTVTIAAGAFEASDEKKMVMLRPLDIVTTAGAAGDIYGAIQTLPGTGVVGEKEGLYVRGGDASETKTFIDGLMVDNPYFTSVPDVPQRGRFSPFLFKGTSFSSGGYSAQYGQAMSSALILESMDLPDKTITNIGIMSVGVSAGHNKRWKNTSLGINGGYTDLSPYFALVKQNREWNDPPKTENGSLVFRHKTSNDGMLKAFVNFSWTQLNIAYLDTSDSMLEKTNNYDLHNFNFFSSFNYKQIILKSWTLYAAGSLSSNKDEIKIDDLPVNHSNKLFDSRLSLSHSIGELSVIRFGAEYQKPFSETNVINFDQEFKETYSAWFAESDIYLTQKLVARLGLRGENSEVLDRRNLAPRASLAYKTSLYNQVSFAFGDFYQLPNQNFILAYPNQNFHYESARHFILNYQHISDFRTFRIETYYKDYNNLFRMINGVADNSGNGYANGFEFFYRDKLIIPKADFWLSYSYLDTKRLYNDFPIKTMPSFAANNTASLVFKYFIQKWSLGPGLTYVYSSGRPYYNPNNPIYLGDRTRDYHNLSFNCNYLTSIKKNFTVLVFSIGNILGIENVFSYNYSSDGLRRVAVGPTAARFYFIGMFMNIGSQEDDSDKYN